MFIKPEPKKIQVINTDKKKLLLFIAHEAKKKYNSYYLDCSQNALPLIHSRGECVAEIIITPKGRLSTFNRGRDI